MPIPPSGIYDFSEMLSLLGNLSKEVEIPVNDLIYEYGNYFFHVLTTHHPDIFNYYKDPISLLASVEDHIHVHVRKIYPGAELPSFEVLEKTDEKIVMMYSSDRGMYRFAQGLMEKTFEHYHRNPQIEIEKIKENGTLVRFTAVINE